MPSTVKPEIIEARNNISTIAGQRIVDVATLLSTVKTEKEASEGMSTITNVFVSTLTSYQKALSVANVSK
jgi:hypothetical protein